MPVITAPPVHLSKNYYTRYVDANGIPVLGAPGTSDAALLAVWEMTANLSSRMSAALFDTIRSRGTTFVAFPADVKLTDLPEYRHLRGTTTFDGRPWDDVRGIGGLTVTTGEEIILNQPNNPYPAGENIALHEFAHNVHLQGLQQDAALFNEIAADYNAAGAAAKYVSAYAASNAQEYWAVGVQAFFDSTSEFMVESGVNTRQELQGYDPNLYATMLKVFSIDAWRPGHFFGRDENNVMALTANRDFVASGGGDDQITAAGGGDDWIDAGPGVDTLALPGGRSAYLLRRFLNEQGVVETGIAGADGDIDATELEVIAFSGVTLSATTFNKESSLDGGVFDDVLVQNQTNGQVFFANMDNGALNGWGVGTGTLGAGWSAVAAGDVNPSAGASRAETFIQQQTDGSIFYASLDTGATTWGIVSTGLTPEWKLRDAADINGDASVDAIVQDSTDGTILFADMRGGAFRSWGVVNQNLTEDWRAVGAGDLNRDGFADVVVQDQDTGTTFYASMANGAFSGWGVVSTALTPAWQARAVADVTGDGFADVIFQNSAGGGGVNPGTTYYADVSGGAVSWGVITASVTADWLVEGSADVDNDGFAEVLFQNLAGGGGVAPGTIVYANMGAAGFQGWGAVASVGSDWLVV